MTLEVFFPIAGMSLSPLLILGLGLMGGFISSMLGIGSGVVITPALMMVGIPPLVAVSSQLNNAIATNLIGFLGYWRLRDVDFGLAWYLFIGGVFGAVAELFLITWLHKGESSYFKMAIGYASILGVLGTVMLVQNIKNLTKPKPVEKVVMMRHWMIYFPWHRIFTRSRTEMSILVPLVVGFLTGLLTSTLGGGNSLFMMPIVGYLIGRSSPVVAGTTLLAGFAITIAVTLVQGVTSAPFDMILVLLLLMGSTIGSQFGLKYSYALPRPYLGIGGAIVILLISSKFAYDLFNTPGKSESIASHVPVDTAQAPTPEIAGGLQKLVALAYNSPMLYLLSGIACVIILSVIIEKVLHRFIAAPQRSHSK